MTRCSGETLIWHRGNVLTAECEASGRDCGFKETMHDADGREIRDGDMGFVIYGTHVLELMAAHLKHRDGA